MDIISIFNQVRDIPYKIPIDLIEIDNCCSGKHKTLKGILEKENYQIRYRVCSFSWSSMNLPEKILSVPHDDLSTHVYLEIFINDKWLIMDATWDSKLKNFFHINQWNNLDENRIAVLPIETFSLEKSLDIMENSNDQEILDDLKINGEFYKSFNNWLEEIRK
jgi:hypothetical protein